MTESAGSHQRISSDVMENVRATQSSELSDQPLSGLVTPATGLSMEEMRARIQLAVEEQKKAQLASYYDQVASGQTITMSRELEELLEEPASTTKLPSTTFTGKSFKEYMSFMVALQTHFQAHREDYVDDLKKVIYAVQYLQGDAQTQWARYFTATLQGSYKGFAWEDFTKWCKDELGDPAVRTRRATRELMNCRQGPYESVRQYLYRMEDAALELPDQLPLSYRIAVALEGFSYKVRTALSSSSDPTTWKLLELYAERAEGVM